MDLSVSVVPSCLLIPANNLSGVLRQYWNTKSDYLAAPTTPFGFDFLPTTQSIVQVPTGSSRYETMSANLYPPVSGNYSFTVTVSGAGTMTLYNGTTSLRSVSNGGSFTVAMSHGAVYSFISSVLSAYQQIHVIEWSYAGVSLQ